MISLIAEAYNNTENTSAVPWHRVIHGSPNASNYLDPKRTCSARFTTADSSSPIALHVSRQSQYHALSRGYRAWKMQNRAGHVRVSYWNPDIDIIVFPSRPRDTLLSRRTPNYVGPRVNCHYWLRLFSLQYPEEAAIASKIAISTGLYEQGSCLPYWVRRKVGSFKILKEMVVFVGDERERCLVNDLIERNENVDRFGPWKLPQDLQGAIAKWWTPTTSVPVVRMVESVERILSEQNLQVVLHCNPCEYFGMG